MKKLISTLFFIFIATCFLNAQQNNTNPYTFWNADMQAIAKPESKEGWIKFKTTLNTPITQIFSLYKSAFGLGINDSMGLIKNWSTNGGEHFKYQQYYYGIKVEGAQYILHQNQNNTITGNGKLANNLNLNVLPIFSKDSCIANAKYHFLNEIINTPGTLINNLKEKALLIINFSVGNSLDYKINFYSNNFDYTYYVNTGNGVINYFHDNHLHSLESKMTNYNGIQNVELSIPITNQLLDTIYSAGSFEIDSIMPPGYHLVDTIRGKGISVEWYNFVQTINNSFTQYGKSTTHSNEKQDYFIKGAIQSLWGTQVFYDFINEKFNLNSIDDNGIKLNINVNRNNTQNSAHAFFHHQLKEDSNGLEIPGTDSVLIHLSNYSTSLNVVGHEWGHGLVKFGPDLLTNGEAFILNEGFGDIFGNLLEIYANKKFNLNIDNQDWIGNSEEPLNTYFNRSMKNPNKYLNPNSVNKRYPSFYQGNFWQPIGDFDSQHHDATVLSHWFYVLSIGGLYINEVGDKYYIQGIGIEEASQLIIQVLREGLLTEDASFHDVREASFQTFLAQQDSCLRFSIQQAWDYVGVYDSTNTLSVIDTSIFLANDTIFNNTDISTAKKIAGIIRVQSALTLNTSNFHIMPHSSIIVENGGTLTLNHANLYFVENTGIIVEEGGSLILNSSLLTFGKDTSSCFVDSSVNELWNGIVFNGTGVLYIDSSTISYSDSGLVVNAPFFTYKNGSYLNNRSPILINNVVINSNNALVKNNLFKNDDNFYPSIYNKTLVQLNGIANLEVSDNDFIQDTYIISTNPVHSAILLENDYAGIGNFGNIKIDHNSFTNFHYGINTNEGNFKTKIEYNNFNSTTFSPKGTGISTLSNASYFDTIRNNTFTNLEVGYRSNDVGTVYLKADTFLSCSLAIHVYYTGHYDILNNVITGNSSYQKGMFLFDNLGTSTVKNNTISLVGMGIEMAVVENTLVAENNISKLLYDYANPIGYGIYAEGCWNFEIKDNIIDNSNIPLQDQIPNGVHGIRGIVIDHSYNGSNKIYRNQITATRYGIQTQGANTTLRMKCNTTKTKFSGLLVFDQLENQGIGCDIDSLNNQLLPGNDWLNVCTSTTTNIYQDIMLSPTALNYNFSYFAHAYGAGGERTAPDCNNINLGMGNYTKCNGAGVNSLQIMASNFCDDTHLYTGWRMAAVDGSISQANIPQEIIDLLAQKLNLANAMAVVQAQITNTETQRELVDKLNYYQSEISNLNKLIVDLYIANDNTAAALLLLEQEQNIDAKMLLAQRYIESNEPVNAQRVINEIIQMNSQDEAFFDNQLQTNFELNKDYTAQLLELDNTLRSSGRKRSQLTALEMADLYQIKDAQLPISIKAEALLAANGVAFESHPIKLLSQDYLNQLNTDMVFNYQMVLNPNPASTNITINYSLPLDAATYIIKIIDNYQEIGNVKALQNINNTNSTTFNVSNYSNGVYTVVIFRDDLSVASAQMVVAH